MNTYISFNEGVGVAKEDMDVTENAVFEAIKNNLPKESQRVDVIKEILNNCIEHLGMKQITL